MRNPTSSTRPCTSTGRSISPTRTRPATPATVHPAHRHHRLICKEILHASAVGVGQHQRHLTAPVLGIRGPIQCSECHQVPANVLSPGHFGQGHVPGAAVGATVFPNVTGSGTLARAQSASPKWNPDTTTCSGAYCHGGGEPLNTDKTPGLMQTPNWVSPDSGACGTACHGIPPQFSGHPTGIARTGCRLPREHDRCDRKYHLHGRAWRPEHDPHERSLRWRLR
jgi:predicted CxxxxCH...CXXCH cytochrome family protein